MASNAAVNHKSRAQRAYLMMETLGAPKSAVTPHLRELLKVYENQWDFIEEDNYRVLIDAYFEASERPKNASSSGRGDGSSSLQGANDGGGGNRDHELHFSPGNRNHELHSSPPPSPPTVTRAAHVTRSRSNLPVVDPGSTPSPSPPPPPPPRHGSYPHAVVKVESPNYEEAVAYHSGENPRLRATGGGGGGGGRGRQDGPHSDPAAVMAATVAASVAAAAAAAAQEKAKGKLPLGAAPSSRRNGEGVPGVRFQQQQKQHQPPPLPSPPLPSSSPLPSSNRRTGSSPALVKVKFEVNSEAETGHELEYVNVAGCEAGAIRETVAHSLSVAAVGSESFDGHEPARIEGNQFISPAPLQSFDPLKGNLLRVKTEPVDEANRNQAARREERISAAAPGADLGERLQVIAFDERPPPFGCGISSDSPSLAGERGTSGALVIKREADEGENDYSRGNVNVYQPPVFPQDGDGGGEPDDGVYVSPSPLLRMGPFGDPTSLREEAPIESSSDPPRELIDEDIRPNFILVPTPKEADLDRNRAALKRRRGAVTENERRRAETEIDDVSIGSRIRERERQQGRNLNPGSGHGCLANSGDERPAGAKRKLVIPAASPRSPAEGNGGTSGGGGGGGCPTTSRSNGAATNGGRLSRSSSSGGNAHELVAAAEPGRQQQQEQQGRQNGLKRPKREELDVVVIRDEDPQHQHYRENAQHQDYRPQPKHDIADISRGTERMAIPVVNEYTSESIPESFNYIPSNVVYQMAHINNSLARIGDEDCCMDCTGDCLKAPHSCPCSRDTGGVYAYTPDGLLKREFINYELDLRRDTDTTPKIFCGPDSCPIERAKNEVLPDKCKGHDMRRFVKECWHKCGCSTRCGNRVVQRGISRRLQVFFTNSGKGWGIRTLEDLPAGAFVCEYVGEIVTNVELDQRNQEMMLCDKSEDHKHTFPVLLDGDWCSERGLKDEEALCLDATRYGNVARFINHRCSDANLIDLPVSIECLDRHYYHIAFFANRFVPSGEELTWDYRIDFDDKDHPIEAFRCLCDSELCRGGSSKVGKKKQKR